jgi:hypothetical protein
MSEQLDPPPFEEIARRGRRRERRRRAVVGGVAMAVVALVATSAWLVVDARDRDGTVSTPADQPTTTSIAQIVGADGRTCADVERDAASGTTTSTEPMKRQAPPDPEQADIRQAEHLRATTGSDLRVDPHGDIVEGVGPDRRVVVARTETSLFQQVEELHDALYASVQLFDASPPGEATGWAVMRIGRADLPAGFADMQSVVSRSAPITGFAVSPDERRLAVATEGPVDPELTVTDLATGDVKPLTQVASAITFDHSGSALIGAVDSGATISMFVDCRTGELTTSTDPGDAVLHSLQVRGFSQIVWVPIDGTTPSVLDQQGLPLGTFELDGREVLAIQPWTEQDEVPPRRAILVDPATGATLEQRVRPIPPNVDANPVFSYGGVGWMLDGS